MIAGKADGIRESAIASIGIRHLHVSRDMAHITYRNEWTITNAYEINFRVKLDVLALSKLNIVSSVIFFAFRVLLSGWIYGF